MATTIEIPEEADDVISEVVSNVFNEIGIKLNKKTLIPFIFSDSKELTDIVLKRIRGKIRAYD